MDRIEALLTRLDEQCDAYLESHNLVRELLTALRGVPQPATSQSLVPTSPQAVDNADLRLRKGSTNSGFDTLITSSTSRSTGEDSDTFGGEEDYYLQTHKSTTTRDCGSTCGRTSGLDIVSRSSDRLLAISEHSRSPPCFLRKQVPFRIITI